MQIIRVLFFGMGRAQVDNNNFQGFFHDIRPMGSILRTLKYVRFRNFPTLRLDVPSYAAKPASMRCIRRRMRPAAPC